VVTKYIIITSINAPGEAVTRFAKWKDWQVVVVGDLKTPEGWQHDDVIYLNLDQQYDLFGDFAHSIPQNTYARKMFGYAYVIKHGADVIFESDDDNIPYKDTDKTVNDLLDGDRTEGERYRSNTGWTNVYKLFGTSRCWPRGFPLEFIKQDRTEEGVDNKPWAVAQFLVDRDPDTDAIYRMTDGHAVYFLPDRKIILDEGTYCPFNSQATLWTREAFPLMFLPVGISDRVRDILRGYMATACLWKAGRSVAFFGPGVFQKRNSHDLHDDFMQEIPLYQNADSWSRLLRGSPGYHEALKRLVDTGDIHEVNLKIYDLFLSAAGLQ